MSPSPNNPVVAGHINYPEGLSHLAAIVAEAAGEQGCEQEIADAIGIGTIERFRKDWGGMQFYVPKLLNIEVSAKHKAIYDEWLLGTPVEQIAKSFGKSLQHTYFILRDMRRLAGNTVKLSSKQARATNKEIFTR
jgi:Mor family transcriptional regulator